MKRVAVIVLAFILMLVPLIGVNCSEGEDEDTTAIKNAVNSIWTAYNQGDYAKALTYCTNYESEDDEIAQMAAMKNFTGNVTVKSIDIINIGNSTAVASVTLNISDQTDTDVVKLDNIDGSWKYDVKYDGSESGYGLKAERKAEKQTIQEAVYELMDDHGLSAIPNPVSSETATNNMEAFPDAISDDETNGGKTTDPQGNEYIIVTGNDLPGYLLCGHDNVGDNDTTMGINYISDNMRHTIYYYTVDSDGTVHQFVDADKTSGEIK